MNSFPILNDVLAASPDYVAARVRTSSGPVWAIPVAVVGGLAYRYRGKIKDLFK
ncbi:MAG: hypothetical protein WAX14_12775 [Rhodococcus sp. (in: high G+C Gram-positive bacteria)]|uniref:hypothetical protein n=1 Tax=Rhodococcus sp. TaxID=1831 RepID=UPI003BB607B6